MTCSGGRFQPLDGFGTTRCRFDLPAKGADHGSEHFAGRGVVIHDQHTQGSVLVIFCRRHAFECAGFCIAAKINGEMKVAALSGCALHLQLTAHQAHQAAADGQAQTDAAKPPRGGGFGLDKTLEYGLQAVGCNANAGVAH